MRRALIGYTGFVGSHLLRDGEYSDLYNSLNFEEMRGQSFEEVVCAGVSAVKWLANKEPEKDWQGIKALLDVLAEVKASRFTLISTIDTYPDPSQPLDETHEVAEDEGQPYGKHRRAVERFVKSHFENAVILRLPALFGTGLKKNIIFDLLTQNQTDKINPAAVFQWYPLSRLADDIRIAQKEDLALVNLFPAPLASTTILDALFPDAIVGDPSVPAPEYRLQTEHAAAFGGPAPYLMSAEQVMTELTRFVESARRNPTEELG